MFDKLIVSQPEGADFKNRRNYFLVSSLVVGVLFLAAVVFSIFAADYNIGDSFDMAELLAPIVQVPQTEPEPQKVQAPASPNRSSSQIPTRQANIQNPDESPVDIPQVSTVANNQLSRPNSPFIADSPLDSDPSPGTGSGRETGPASGPSGLAVNPTVETERVPEPPTVKPPTPAAPTAPKSMGVVNGMAQNLPKPNYPAAAVAINLQGKVDVQVLIDETGRVISAKALSGNAIFRSAAEQAARNARFSPTLLSKVPIKVTGIIVYNFTRG